MLVVHVVMQTMLPLDSHDIHSKHVAFREVSNFQEAYHKGSDYIILFFVQTETLHFCTLKLHLLMLHHFGAAIVTDEYCHSMIGASK
jgi:hypothetical protein